MTVLAVLGAVGLLLALLAVLVTTMPGTSYRGALPPATGRERDVADRIARHVATLATEVGERNVWCAPALETAALYIERTLTALGYEVETQEFEVFGKRVRNLDAELRGTSRPSEYVVVGAHYDSVVGCPGANDNASGVGAMLELARLLRGGSLARTVRFVAFVNEEPPFSFTANMGSRRYARRSRERRERVVAMLSLETIGCYRDGPRTQAYPFPFGLLYPRTGDFIAFVGNLRSRALVRRCVGAFRRHARFPSEGAAAPGYLPGVFWSDHWSFWRERYPAVMVTDTALFRYAEYHTPEDTPDRVDCARVGRVVVGLASVVQELSG